MAYVAKPDDGIAWVTGAGAGLGRAVAMELAEQGWTVVATSTNEISLETLVAGGSAGPGSILSVPCDVSKGGTIGQLVPRIEKKVGPIALAVLSMAPPAQGDASLLDRDAFQRSMEGGYFGVTNCLAPVLSAMRSRRQGQVALVSALGGQLGPTTQPLHGAAAAALSKLAENLHGDLAAQGIRLHIVQPGHLAPEPQRIGWVASAFAMSHHDAAAELVRMLSRPKGFAISLPWGLRYLTGLVGALPYPAFFRAAAFIDRHAPEALARMPRRAPAVAEAEQER